MAHPPDHRRSTALAWSASMAIHATLTASAVWVTGARGGLDEGDGPVREVGVVLRTDSIPPEPFDERAPDPVEPAEPTQPTEPTAEPSAPPPPSPFSALLEEMLTDGPTRAEDPSRRAGDSSGESAASDRAAWSDLPIGQTRVSVFGVEGQGSRFVYAFDRSISMQGAPLRAAKAQLIASLDALDSNHQFQVIFFNINVTAYDLTGQRRLAFATEQSKRRAAAFVQTISAEGGTERYQALRRALQYRPDAVFFLTDADGGMDPQEFVRVVDDARRNGVSIQAIEFGIGPQRGVSNFLVELAKATGGQYGYVDTRRLAPTP